MTKQNFDIKLFDIYLTLSPEKYRDKIWDLGFKTFALPKLSWI
jgi:hypothetical protein